MIKCIIVKDKHSKFILPNYSPTFIREIILLRCIDPADPNVFKWSNLASLTTEQTNSRYLCGDTIESNQQYLRESIYVFTLNLIQRKQSDKCKLLDYKTTSLDFENINLMEKGKKTETELFSGEEIKKAR